MAAERDTDPFWDARFEQAVRETAYFLWEQDGGPEGREKDYWLLASERTLRERKANDEIRRNPDEQSTGVP